MPALHTLKPQTVSTEASEEVMPTDQPIDEEKEAHRRRSIRKRDAEDVPPRGGPDFREVCRAYQF
jgi:hypothetical protein